MINMYPEYYQYFKCIADKCPDTCCAQWEVVVNEDFKARCLVSHSHAAKKALDKMYTDKDGDLCLELTNGRCPMLNGDNLCEIYIDMGKDALCDVCKNYPRFFKEQGSYSINGISVSCPEAARIILSDDSKKTITLNSFAKNDEDKIFFEVYNLLTEIIFKGDFFDCDFEKLEFVSDEMIFNKDMFDSNTVCHCFENAVCKYDTGFATDFFDSLKKAEFLTKDWQELVQYLKAHIDKCNSRSDYAQKCDTAFWDLSKTSEIKNFAVYFLYKYLWEAIHEQSIELWIKRAYSMARLACELYCAEFLKSDNITTDQKLRICQLISKEFEHSDDNLDLFDQFCM